MDYNKIEDSIMKNAMDIFKQSAVNFFNLKTKIIAPANTEFKDVSINTNFTDYTFYTENGDYLHFEFQTTYKEDINRFLFYDASLCYKHNRKVKRLAIYSLNIKEAKTKLDAGTIKSIELAGKTKEGNSNLQCLSLLYALLEKFGDDESRRKFNEVFTTKI